MKYLVFIILISLSSCLTEKKVNGWLDEHKPEAATYCATKFPPDTLTKTVVNNIDSAGYFDAYMNMSYLADSLFYRLDSLQNAATPDKPFKINIDSVRRVVDKEIRKRLAPCVDTVFITTYTVRDRAKEVELQGKLDEKDKVIAARDKRITELESKVKAKNKWVWLFWGLVVLVGGYTILKAKFKFLPVVIMLAFMSSCKKDGANKNLGYWNQGENSIGFNLFDIYIDSMYKGYGSIYFVNGDTILVYSDTGGCGVGNNSCATEDSFPIIQFNGESNPVGVIENSPIKDTL